ncbi:hypothetical protein ElyMa_001812600 [Elysia marginata]|uniref:Uncharacterized protein n=1 Tax=Elysia marginata TaxID=1093978 RepID=A0AAV4EHD4_9GAST|nr:hypothetical protein ElyMa_001812600 [Elysia marginata]
MLHQQAPNCFRSRCDSNSSSNSSRGRESCRGSNFDSGASDDGGSYIFDQGICVLDCIQRNTSIVSHRGINNSSYGSSCNSSNSSISDSFDYCSSTSGEYFINNTKDTSTTVAIEFNDIHTTHFCSGTISYSDIKLSPDRQKELTPRGDLVLIHQLTFSPSSCTSERARKTSSRSPSLPWPSEKSTLGISICDVVTHSRVILPGSRFRSTSTRQAPSLDSSCFTGNRTDTKPVTHKEYQSTRTKLDRSQNDSDVTGSTSCTKRLTRFARANSCLLFALRTSAVKLGLSSLICANLLSRPTVVHDQFL